ncbi:MAG: hypothetical protein JRD68_01955 [Deltaproteobacteria bacterium]|nr:hypothetical protein [Deltaproteobacteria bacterium]
MADIETAPLMQTLSKQPSRATYTSSAKSSGDNDNAWRKYDGPTDDGIETVRNHHIAVMTGYRQDWGNRGKRLILAGHGNL